MTRQKRSSLFLAGMILTFAVASGVSYSAVSDDIKGCFERGNACYLKGDYPGAIAEYEKIARDGYDAASVYFNLGNAYFKTGDKGKAILNYERAERLSPRDRDIAANVKFIKASINTPPDEMTGIWSVKALRDYKNNFTVNGLTLISSVLYLMGILFFLLAIFFVGIRRDSVIIGILALILAAGNLYFVNYKVRETSGMAIITGEETESYYGPFDSATAFFKLHRGMTVEVTQKSAGWCKIRRGDGKVGWVKAGELEVI